MGQEESEREEAGAAGDGRRGCDFCGDAAAVVYCRADAARLCLECDRRVHAANSVSSQHHRALLCDGCRAAASAFLCSSAPHRLLLCSNCDFDAHRGCDGLHDRRPVEPFSGCPSALELASIFGVGTDEKSVVSGFLGKEEVLADDGWLWEETSPVLTLEDLIVPTTSHHGFQAMGGPPWPKNRKLTCGKHKEEILRQLHELVKPETRARYDHEELQPINEFQSLIEQQDLHQGNLNSDFDQDATSIFVPNSEATALQWNDSDYNEAADRVTFSFEQLVGSSSLVTEQFLKGTAGDETSVCHASGGERDPGHPVVNVPSLLPKGGVESGFPDRDSVISRYKEKRKTRRYDKLIRYESRKARADSRTRIKGRFAKANQVLES